jgi:hypothetical protein
VRPDRIAGRSDTFINLPRRERDQLRRLIGHMPFGLGSLLAGPVLYATMLRNPVERALSDFFYCRSEPDNAAYLAARSMSASEFGEGGFSQARNGMVCYLSNAAFGMSYFSDDEMLAAAAKALLCRRLIGLYESFKMDLRLLQLLLHMPPRPLSIRNARHWDHVVGSADCALIAAASRADLALYRLGLTLRRSWGGAACPPELQSIGDRDGVPCHVSKQISLSARRMSSSFQRRTR